MKTKFSNALCWTLLSIGLLPNVVSADWLTLPGPYSHDVATGQRVAQFAPIEPPTTAVTAPLRTSGYTHFRSTLAYGQSADNYHRVEEWGDPVRPYGEWRFPFRPFSTPYPNWGQPYGGLNLGIGLNPFAPGNFPTGQYFPGQFGPGQNGAFQDGGGQNVPGQNPNNPNLPPRRPGFQNRPNPGADANLFSPYPSGRGTPYPVAPYYDGYYPNYRN